MPISTGVDMEQKKKKLLVGKVVVRGGIETWSKG